MQGERIASGGGVDWEAYINAVCAALINLTWCIPLRHPSFASTMLVFMIPVDFHHCD